jgi:MFS family permease
MQMSLDLQAVYHFSATDAGVRLLPMILVQIVVMIASARVIPLIGRFKWVIVAGPMFIGLGSGLLYSIKSGTPISHLYGFQVLIGIGIGLALQNSMLAIQYELKAEPKLISAGTGAGTFLGFMGRIIGISLGGSVFENMIQVNLHKYAPTLPPSLVHAVVSNAAAIWTQVPESFRPDVLYAYTETIRVVYLIGLPMAILGMLGGLMIKNGKMPRKDDAPIGPGVTAAVAAGVETKSENGGRVEDAELAPKETEREQRERQ